MEAIVGYSPEKSQNMIFIGGLRKHVPITQIAFLVGTLSLFGIPPLACFWSKDEILSDSWLYSPIFAIIAWSTTGLTTFYMFRIYLLTFEGHSNVHFQKYSVEKSNSFCSIKLWAIPFNQEGMHLDILSKLLTPSINLLHQNSNDFEDSCPKRILLDKMIYLIYDWSYNRGYIDMFYSISLTKGIRGLAELTHFF
ncbi:NADH dehydrogenase [Gossypium australe]|uniref:NAD(P)H-quinone oxidoreductase subunit 5, chloroplastic n=1 Tax=Gossypium australe TaxID=47621 RepID=A0A5B6X6C2_9ROSI|nr:NADH dehydrogenase [Gossypium australe]